MHHLWCIFYYICVEISEINGYNQTVQKSIQQNAVCIHTNVVDLLSDTTIPHGIKALS
jgi:hypothetical protein